MCSLILFSLYTKYLLKYKNRIIKKRGIDFIKKDAVYKKKKSLVYQEKSVTKVKLVAKIDDFWG